MKLTQLGSLYKLIRGESRNMRKSVAKQPRQRASAFMLESLENRVLLSATPVDVTTTEPVVTAAVVTTDKPDYAPGETALITTSNTSAEGLKFGDGELVQFQVTRTDGIEDAPMGNLPWFVIDGVSEAPHEYLDANGQTIDSNADGMADWIRPDNDGTVNGSISTEWFVEDQYLGASLQLTATGQEFGAVATTQFTDALTVTSVSPNTGSTLGGTVVTITGVGFTNGQDPFTVSFDGGTTFVSATRTDNTHLTATTPAHSAGTFDVFVRDKGAITGQATLANGFTYVNAITTTTTTVSSSDDTSTYGDSVTFTATVARTTGTGAPTGSVTFNIAGIGTGLVGTAGSTTATTATWTYTTTATALTAGNHSVQAFYAHSGSFTDSTSGNITQTVSQADANVTINPYSGIYDAAAHNLTGSVVGVVGDPTAVGSSLTFGSSYTNAGSHTGTWTFEGGTNYLDESGSAAITIAQADANVTINPYSGIYDAAAHNLTGSVVGVVGDPTAVGSSLTFGSSYTNAGSHTGTWTFEGGTNYLDESGSAAITIAQADANVTINPYSGIYDAAAHNLTGSVVGVVGDPTAVGSSLTFGSSYTNAGSHTGTWTFEGGTNYLDESGSAAITIAQADANVTINPYSGIYDAAAHNLTGSVVGVVGDPTAVGSSLTFGSSYTNAGSHTGTWTFEGGTNYLDESGSAAITIAQADANVTINPYSGIYDAAAHNLTGSVVGVVGDPTAVGSSLTFGSSYTNAGSHTGTWTFEGGTNYLDESGSAAITIAQADANVTINPYSGIYDAAAHNLTGSVVGVVGDPTAVGSSLTFGSSYTNAGSHTGTWTFEGGTNYLDESGSAAITIAQADANVTINPYSGIYDAAAHNLTGSVVGVVGDPTAVGSSLTFGSSYTNAGSHTGTWTFEGGTNYLDESGSAAITIAQADANVTINPYSGIYDAAAHNLTGSVVGVVGDPTAVGSSLTFGSSYTNAGSHTGTWTFEGGTNYLDESGSAAITIAQADANVTINPYSGIYDAAAHNLTGSVVGVVGDPTAVGSSLTFGSSYTNAGSHTGTWTFEGGTNYLDESGSAAITIAQADANVTINPYSGIYDAAAHNLTGSVVGVVGDPTAVGSSLTFGSSYTNAGSHTGTWTFEGGTNYLDESGSAAITIAQADANVTINPYSGIYDAAAHNLTGSVVGVVGDPTAVGSSLTFGSSYTNAGSHTGTWTFEGGTNYLDESGSAAITIAQADANVTINPYSGIYDAAAHNLTGSVVGVVGDPTAVGSSLTFGSSYTNAGSHTGTWTFEGGTNYLDESGSAAITIAQADANVTINPYSGIYDAAAHNLTGSVVGVVGDPTAVGSSLTFGSSYTNAGSHTGTWTFEGGTNYLDESGSAAITIAQASSTTTNNGVPSNAVYTGSAQGISGTTVTGAGGLATVATSTVYYDTLGTVATGDDVLLGGAPTNAGSYRVVSTYVGDLNHTGSSDTDYFSIGKVTLTGLATTQSALNIAKQGALVFSLNSVTGMVNGDTLVSLLSSMSFTLKIGVNTYAFAPSVAIDTHGDGDASNDTVVVTYSLKNGGDAGLLAADLQLLNSSDGIDSTSASNAQLDAIWVNMSTANYTFSDDALTKLFNSLK